MPLSYSGSGIIGPQVLLVDKETMRLYLYASRPVPDEAAVYESPGQLTLLDAYAVLLGSKNGDKRARGDMRTPEGMYRILKWIDRLPARYGPGAFTLDYPNLLDQIRGKTGNGIWVHGMDPVSKKFDTRGCVALANNDLKMLKKAVRPGMSILISPQLVWGSEAERKQNHLLWRGRVEAWLDAWERGDAATFSSFLGAGFPGKQRFLEHKKMVWSHYPVRTLALGPLEVFQENDNEAVVRFSHMYIADNLKEWGERTLYFDNVKSGSPRIIAHKWVHHGDILDTLFRGKNIALAAQRDKEKLLPFWNAWRDAYLARSLFDLLPFYHPNFTSQEGDASVFLAKNFESSENSKVQVTVGEPVGGSINSDTYFIGFSETLVSPDTSPLKRTKILVCRLHDGKLLIFREFDYKENR